MSDSPSKSGLPSDARTIQWAPNVPAVAGSGKPGQGSIGACDACRARKVRCLASEDNRSSKCQRCARAGRECVYTVHSKTRRRKRTDTRVKELEEKVKNLSVLLEQGRGGAAGQAAVHANTQSRVDLDDGMEEEEEEDEDETDEGEEEEFDAPENASDLIGTSAQRSNPSSQNRRTSNHPSQSSDSKSKSQSSFRIPEFLGGKKRAGEGPSLDAVDRGLLTMKEATELFDRYVNVLAPNYPSVVFPHGTTATEVREKRPILFLATLAAAASSASPDLNLKLNQEILNVYATKVALEGQKNIDLVQSILISSLWYYPPERFDQLKFHQYIHMAATMALDLGLGKRPRNRNRRGPPKPAVIPDYEPHRANESNMMSSPEKPAPDSTTIESRRTLLACYLQCASVSLSLRLPNALRFTSYMAECLEVLEMSPDAAPTDRRFTAWVRIQRIVEDCVNSFALDDPESTVSLSDIRIQNQLKGYEHQMKEFLKNLRPGVMNSFLDVNFHVNNVFMHEISMHPDHEPEDFRPPFYVATQIISNIPTNQNPSYVNAIMECVSSAQSMLNIFIKMPLETIRALPALIFVRTIYCCVVLIKLEISINAPGSELAHVLDQRSLKVPIYLQKIITNMAAVVGNEGKYIIASKFLLIMQRLVEWYRGYKTQLAAGGDQHPEPFQAPKPPQPSPQPPQPQSSLPDFNSIPRPQWSSFSQQQQPQHQQQQQQQQQQQLPATAQSFPSFQGPAFSPPTSPPQPQQPYDFHGAMLAANTSSPSSGAGDYNSPEYYPPGDSNTLPNSGPGDGSSSVGGGSVGGQTPEFNKMEVDPGIFNQLQNIDQPFAYNPDPNDWMFDLHDMMGLDSVGMGGGGMGMGMMMGGMGGGVDGMGGSGMGQEYEWQQGPVVKGAGVQ